MSLWVLTRLPKFTWFWSLIWKDKIGAKNAATKYSQEHVSEQTEDCRQNEETEEKEIIGEKEKTEQKEEITENGPSSTRIWSEFTLNTLYTDRDKKDIAKTVAQNLTFGAILSCMDMYTDIQLFVD